MSTRFEWMNDPSVQYLPEGYDVRTGEPADENTGEESLTESDVIILWGDEATVITGDHDQLARVIMGSVPSDEGEPVIFRWTRDYGDCYDCGLPAAFFLPRAYINEERTPGAPDQRPTETNKRCAVCAANDAANGETIARIDGEFA